MTETRQLAAIMFLDIVGYTSTMANNEVKALTIVNQNRGLLRIIVEKHNGKYIKEIGDGTLCSFHSAVDAVNCAISIQKIERSYQLRIGIHLGDIVFSNNDVFGDGVNIAARIEQLAPNNGICISEQVYDSIRSLGNFYVRSLGKKEMKNVGRSIIVYELLNKGKSLKLESNDKNNKTKLIIPTIAILVIMILSGFYFDIYSSSILGTKQSRKLPSIAVLPFQNLSNDKTNQYFADGIMESILNHLAKVKDIYVISRTSMESFRGTQLNVQEIAEKLNVSHILEGSVQKDGTKVRITTQLIEAKTDAHLWSEHYDGEIIDIFELQSKIAIEVTSELEIRISQEFQNSIKNLAPLNAGAYQSFFKARKLYQSDNYLEASILYSNAISFDSTYVLAYLGRAASYRQLYWTSGETNDSLKNLSQLDLQRAKSIQLNLPEVFVENAWQLFHLERKYESAIKKFQEAKRLMPSNIEVYEGLSSVYESLGNFKSALNESNQILKLDPLSAESLTESATLLTLNGQYREAFDKIELSESIDSSLTSNFRAFWIYLIWKGNIKEAQRYSEIDSNNPHLAFFNEEYRSAIKELSKKPLQTIDTKIWYFPNSLLISYYSHMIQNTSKTKEFANTTITFLNNKLKKAANDNRVFAALGIAHALKGNTKKAIELVKKSKQLKPIELDAKQAAWRELDLLITFILCKKFDLAFTKIEYLLKKNPNFTLPLLKSAPIFKSLRKKPRYKKIITNVKKKNEA